MNDQERSAGNSKPRKTIRRIIALVVLLLVAFLLTVLRREAGSRDVTGSNEAKDEHAPSRRVSKTITNRVEDGVKPTHDDDGDSGKQASPKISNAIEIFGRVFLVGKQPPERILFEQRFSNGSTKITMSRDYEVSLEDGLANVFVYIERGLEKRTFPAPTRPIRVTETNNFLEPFVFGVQVEQPIEIENTIFPHHYRLKSSHGHEFRWERNALQESVFSERDVLSHVTCKFHQWEWGYMGAVEHPFFAVTDSNGYFRLPKGILPGEYIITVVHPKAGEASQKLKAEAGSKYDLTFKLKAPAAIAGANHKPVVEEEGKPLEEPLADANSTVAAGPRANGGIGGAENGSGSGKGSIVGVVRLKGTPPPEKPIDALINDPVCGKLIKEVPKTKFYVVGDNKSLADVVVSIQGLRGMSNGGKAEPVLLDQVKCQYIPYIAAVQTGQKIRVRNSDLLFHNVHPTPAPGTRNKESNKAQMPNAKDLEFTFEDPEPFIRFKCDVHPWMFSYVSVFDHPYFAVSAEDGTFTITNVPPGKYTVEATHRKGGTVVQEVEVGDSKAVVDFVIEAR